MNIRYVLLLILVLLCTSCDFFSFTNKNKEQAVDTIIDFTKVDVSPAFNKCKNLLNEAKTNCFRKEIHERIADKLQRYNFITHVAVDEEILINVVINPEGNFQLKNIQTSSIIKEQLPDLEKTIQAIINELPKVSPAIKRGVIVTTQYQLPIKIQTN
ncbi:hypothetical protein [Tenacibaculum caenipelagi]|uniref:TonB-like protein n=1 Tax=Tenacibaculum caenipelagi TaxID=1325435 RepID=A0A4R6TD66_9FLAO|nr:hypothetical protein [Tenacibaculum caenipelagi]TDQ22877.1 hypothetical protein DFQ07_2899 [Tenacibaculum caenipelagi]